MAKTTMEKEDYVEGCFKEFFMVPHICPLATFKWCKNAPRCKSMNQKRNNKTSNANG